MSKIQLIGAIIVYSLNLVAADTKQKINKSVLALFTMPTQSITRRPNIMVLSPIFYIGDIHDTSKIKTRNLNNSIG